MGLADGALGVAWPSLRAAFGRPVADLATLLVAGTVGALAASAASGALGARFGPGRLLVALAGVVAAGLAVVAAAPAWPAVVAAALALGLGGGALDAGLNAHAALRHGVRAVGLLHASYGAGATLGPLLLAALLEARASWRVAYALLAGAQVLVVVAFWASRRRWGEGPAARPDGHGDEAPGAPPRARAGLGALSLALFFAYTGVEVAAGQWSFSLLVEARGFRAAPAGLWVASFWGGLTAGRLLVGALGGRVAPRRLLDASVAGALAGTAWLWWDPAGAGAAGLPLTGLSLAAVYPTLVALTPVRLGAGRARAAVGYQTAAAVVGAAALPAAVGAAAGRRGLEAVGPLLVAGTLAVAALHLATARLAKPVAAHSP